jgi:hypothetical protein
VDISILLQSRLKNPERYDLKRLVTGIHPTGPITRSFLHEWGLLLDFAAMNFCVTAITQSDQIPQNIIAKRAARPDVVNLEIDCAPATLAFPAIPLDYLPTKC